ncbi:thioredoxin [Thiohalocapsa halophila]|uniref:Thioredoxin n=2 Tax=Thiohalocapsa halophila TaxID=69359 RepID=A0ABS1CD76_9GAMM|nr:thioredoxin [Thiohalocapsa halophila]
MLAVLLLALGGAPAAAAAADTGTGKVLGGKMSSHPDWFKESFLDIAEDVDEAADAGRHVILFLEMNGCPYCFKMIEENFKGSDYSDWLRERFDVIALNVRGDREVAMDAETMLSEKALAEALGVRYTPTVIFLSQANEPVARVNGYRNVPEFKQVLDYVDAQAYQSQTLAEYLDAQKAETAAATGAYAFREHALIREATDVGDLSAIDGPLLLLFEDTACVACDALHDGHLKAPEVAEALAPYTVVRVDALSDAGLTGPDGQSTTGRQLAEALGIEYRPALVLMDGPTGGKDEIARIESMLYRYHFVGLLEYVGLGKYRDFPDGPFDYIDDKTARLTAAGEDVSISDE